MLPCIRLNSRRTSARPAPGASHDRPHFGRAELGGTVLDPRFLVAGKIEATGEGWNWIEATGVLGVDVGWVNGNHQRILFHSVRTVHAVVPRTPGDRPSTRRAFA